MKLLIITLLILISSLTFAENISKFKETVKGKESNFITNYELKQDKDEWVYSFSNSRNESEKVYMDEEFSTKWAEYKYKNKNTDFKIVRDKNILIEEGTIYGTKQKNSIKINSNKWYGNIIIGISGIVKRNQKKATFWTVSPEDFSILELTAVKDGSENWDGVNVVRYKVTHSGVLSIFWSSYYWYTINGEFLKYKGKKGVNTPEYLIERVEKIK